MYWKQLPFPLFVDALLSECSPNGGGGRKVLAAQAEVSLICAAICRIFAAALAGIIWLGV